MYLYSLSRNSQRHLIAKYFRGCGHERVGEWIGGQAGAIQKTPSRLDILEHVREFPANSLKVRDWFAKDRALANVVYRFIESAFRQTKRNGRIQATLSIERAQQAAETIFFDHQVFQRQLAVVELDFV